MKITCTFHTLIFFLSLSIFLVTIIPIKAESSQTIRATYVWNTGEILNDSTSFIDFAVKNSVNTVYLHIDIDIRPQVYQAFIGRVSEEGIAVHALGGDPHWVLKDHRKKLIAWVDWVKAYNESAKSDEAFAALHLDMEPYTLPEWKENPDAVISLWKDAVTAYVNAATKGKGPLPAEADLPFWLDKFSSGDKKHPALSTWMIDKLDRVTLMAYRDNALGKGGIVYIVENEIMDANRLGKPIIVAVETNPSSEAEYVTFFEEGQAVMNSELSIVQQELEENVSFAGIAVHDYSGWSQLKP